MSPESRLRITAGTLRGRRLCVPPRARPSSGRLREALFSIWGDRVRGAAVLDLFAGSGAVGLEALSRGAARATFVESDPDALAALARNLELVPGGAARIVRGTVSAACARGGLAGAPFDLVFADPPYGARIDAELFAELEPLARSGAALAVEHRGDLPASAHASSRWRWLGTRRYGGSALSLFERIEA